MKAIDCNKTIRANKHVPAQLRWLVIRKLRFHVPSSGNTSAMDQFVTASTISTEPPEWRVPSKDHMRSSGQVQSLSRALKILSALSHHTGGLTLSETAVKVGLPPSTTHRLLATLQSERFVRFDSGVGRWRVGLQAFRIGQGFLNSRDAGLAARPFIRKLVADTGETIRLLAADDEAKPRAASLVIRAYNCPLDELAAIRACSYAVVDEDTPVGFRGIAAAIFDEHGAPLAALTLSGPSQRIPDGRATALGMVMAAMAKEITAELGGIAPKGGSVA